MVNYIHCLLKGAVTTYGKPRPIFLKGQLKPSEKSHTHTLPSEKNSDILSKFIHCILKVQWQHMENRIYCFLKKWSDKICKTTPIVWWNSSDNIYGNKSAANQMCSDNTLKTTSTAFERQQWQHMEIYPPLNKFAR